MNMINHQFSIVIPVKNGGAYLKECINSILNQTYQNFNIIILENNSSDGTNEWLRELKNEKIIVHYEEKPLGIEGNWARIKDVPKNEFMTIMGQDDLLHPNFLVVINNLINQHPTASLYHTHFNYVDAEGNIIKPCKPMPNQIGINEFIKLFLTYKIDIMGTGYVTRSKDYEKIGGIPLHYPSLLKADFELWMELAEISYEAIAAENCFSFRIHQSTTTTSSNMNTLIAFEKFVSYLKSKMSNPQLEKTIKENCLYFIGMDCQALTHRLIKTPLQKRTKDETVKNIIDRCKACANLLIPNSKFNAGNSNLIRMALIIDSNIITKKLFLEFKRVVKNPIF